MNWGSKGEVPAPSKTHTTSEVALSSPFLAAGLGSLGKAGHIFSPALNGLSEWVGLFGGLIECD